jgi:hypothetical protein
MDVKVTIHNKIDENVLSELESQIECLNSILGLKGISWMDNDEYGVSYGIPADHVAFPKWLSDAIDRIYPGHNIGSKYNDIFDLTRFDNDNLSDRDAERMATIKKGHMLEMLLDLRNCIGEQIYYFKCCIGEYCRFIQVKFNGIFYGGVFCFTSPMNPDILFFQAIAKSTPYIMLEMFKSNDKVSFPKLNACLIPEIERYAKNIGCTTLMVCPLASQKSILKRNGYVKSKDIIYPSEKILGYKYWTDFSEKNQLYGFVKHIQ